MVGLRFREKDLDTSVGEHAFCIDLILPALSQTPHDKICPELQ